MNTLNKTCGIFIFNPDNTVLICHVTNSDSNTWSIPKGRPDSLNELSIDTAVRELYEETGLGLDKKNLISIGSSFYKSGREFVGFVYKSKDIINISSLNCSSMFEKNGIFFPEVDEFIFMKPVDIINKKLIHDTQIHCLSMYMNL